MSKGGYQIIDFENHNFGGGTVVTIKGIYAKVLTNKPMLITNFKLGVDKYCVYATKCTNSTDTISLTFLLSKIHTAEISITPNDECVFSMKQVTDSGGSEPT